MIDLLIIADDLTGALDTSAQFATRGITTRVVCGSALESTQISADTRVLCIDAETRHLSPEDAYHTVQTLTQAAMANGIGIIFKKVDSTLRGQIGSELAALLDTIDDLRLAFAPAFPSTGRTTSSGRQYVNGHPLHETVFAKDPFEPIVSSDVEEIIRMQRKRDIVSVPVGQTAPIRTGKRIEVFDALTVEDMRSIASRLLDQGYRAMAGCAGLAKALAEQMAGPCLVSKAPKKKEGLLIVCGSLNPISQQQMAYVQNLGFVRLEIPIAHTGKPDIAAYAIFLDQLHELSSKGINTILHASKKNDKAMEAMRCIEQERLTIARQIGKAACDWYDMEFDHAVAITGGDTLHAFLECVGPDATLEPICELQPGVICSVLKAGNRKRPLQVISKAGGFGVESVFLDIAKAVLPIGIWQKALQ